MLLRVSIEKVEEEIGRGEPGEGHVPPLVDDGPRHLARLSKVDTYYCIMPASCNYNMLGAVQILHEQSRPLVCGVSNKEN